MSIFAALLLSAGAAHVLLYEPWSWINALFVLVAPLSIAGVVEAFTSRVELHSELMVVVAGFRRQEYSRSEFLKVVAEKGVPIALQRTDGTWLQLPPVGTGQGTVNSLRAWVRRKQ